MTEPYSSGQLEALVGINQRCLQFWIDRKILRVGTEDTPEQAIKFFSPVYDDDKADDGDKPDDRDVQLVGRGNPRQFTSFEVKMAFIAKQLANSGTTARIIRDLLRTLRYAIHHYDLHMQGRLLPGNEPRMVELGRKMRRAMRNEGRNILQICFSPSGSWIDVATDEDGPPNLDPDAFFPLDWNREVYGNIIIVDLAIWRSVPS